MIQEITNFRNFREKLRYYLDQTVSGKAIAIKSKEREVVLISMEEYRNLTMDDTEYLLSTEANKEHLMESRQEAKEGKLNRIKTEVLWK
ncbi:MAG: prevent-host-death protein [Cytophagales bacterium]|nr:prevent-host-death protein [Cytophagales bacterium]